MALYGIETESESRTDVARRIDRDIVGTGTLCSEAGEQVKIYDCTLVARPRSGD
jgi:hypothetical protein